MKKRKFTYILCLILTLLCLTMFTEPTLEAYFLGLLFTSLLGWLTVIRKGEYDEAKFKVEVYQQHFGK